MSFDEGCEGYACVPVTGGQPFTSPSCAWPTTGLEVTRRDSPGLVVVVVRGAIDVAQSLHLSTALDEVLATAPRRLVVDLCAAELVDSAGLAVLVRARRCALRLGVKLTLACDVPRTLKVLALTGLDRSFDILRSGAV
jgi:anti-sigma B factor antagonist